MMKGYDQVARAMRMHHFYRQEHSLLETGRAFHLSAQRVHQTFRKYHLWIREPHKRIKREVTV